MENFGLFAEKKRWGFCSFKSFHIFVTTQTGSRRLRCLQTDNEGEFLSIEFRRFWRYMVRRGRYQPNTALLLRGWLKDMIGHYIRGWDACCPQLISFMPFDDRLKLQYVHTIVHLTHHWNVASQRRFGLANQPNMTIYSTSAEMHLCTLDMRTGIKVMQSPWRASSLSMMRKVKWTIWYGYLSFKRLYAAGCFLWWGQASWIFLCL